MSSKMMRLTRCLDQLSRRIVLDGAKHISAEVDFDSIRAELNLLVKAAKAGSNRHEGLSSVIASLEELDRILSLLEVDRSANVVPFAVPTAGADYTDNVQLSKKAARLLALAIGGLTAISSVVPAAAQSMTQPTYVGMTAQNEGVLDRPHPEYDAKGIPMGGFRLFPSMRASANYDSNVLRNAAPTSDFFYEETPSLRLQSQWGRHFFEIYGGLDNYNYSKTSRLDLTDWNVGSDGRLDVSRALIVTGAGSYGQYHEALQSPNTVGFQKSPNRYDRGHTDMTASYQPNRLGLGLGASYDRYNWQNTPLIGPPPGTLFNSDRNENIYQAYARGSYDFSPGYSGFIKATYEDRSFDHLLDRSGVHRSSLGYHVDAGLDMQLSHLVSGEVFVGYLDQKFSAPLKNVTGFDYGVGLDWYASPVFTAHLTASHQISDTILAGVTATDDQSVRLSGEYEFRRNIIVKGFAAYANERFVGTTRTDNLPGAGISMSYLMNRYMSADLGYTYTKRSSNVAAVEYNDNLVSAGITLHI